MLTNVLLYLYRTTAIVYGCLDNGNYDDSNYDNYGILTGWTVTSSPCSPIHKQRSILAFYLTNI